MATTHHHRVADLDRRARQAAACNEAAEPRAAAVRTAGMSSCSYCVPSQGAADANRQAGEWRVSVGVDFERKLLLAERARASTYMTPTPSCKRKPDRRRAPLAAEYKPEFKMSVVVNQENAWGRAAERFADAIRYESIANAPTAPTA